MCVCFCIQSVFALRIEFFFFDVGRMCFAYNSVPKPHHLKFAIAYILYSNTCECMWYMKLAFGFYLHCTPVHLRCDLLTLGARDSFSFCHTINIIIGNLQNVFCVLLHWEIKFSFFISVKLGCRVIFWIVLRLHTKHAITKREKEIERRPNKMTWPKWDFPKVNANFFFFFLFRRNHRECVCKKRKSRYFQILISCSFALASSFRSADIYILYCENYFDETFFKSNRVKCHANLLCKFRYTLSFSGRFSFLLLLLL